jgi:hypothetical protein
VATCPFCMETIHDDALVCRACGAKKGYTSANGRVGGKSYTVAFGIVLPVLLLVAPLYKFGAVPITLIWAAILAIPILWSAYNLSTGPRWFR